MHVTGDGDPPPKTVGEGMGTPLTAAGAGSPSLRHTAGLAVTARGLSFGRVPPGLQVAQPHLQHLMRRRPGLREGRKGAPQNRPPGGAEAGSPPRWAAGFRSGWWNDPLPLHARGSTHSSEGRVQGPVAKAVLQEEVQLLLDEPRDGGPVGGGGVTPQSPGHPAAPSWAPGLGPPLPVWGVGGGAQS